MKATPALPPSTKRFRQGRTSVEAGPLPRRPSRLVRGTWASFPMRDRALRSGKRASGVFVSYHLVIHFPFDAARTTDETFSVLACESRMRNWRWREERTKPEAH